ncbi:MAG: DMT family transporter [Clostridiaceae bacterium]
MYYFVSLIIGILVAVMITVNGGLTTLYGVYSATVIIHIVGLLLIGGIILARKEKPFQKGLPWYLYIGGVIGVASTVFTNYAFGKISVSAILALSLFGSSVMGLLVDQFGLFQMRVHRFRLDQVPGLLLVVGGIVCMTIGSFSILPVLAVFSSGLLLVVSRSFNSRLAERTSLYSSTFFNYLSGLITVIPVFLLLGRGEPSMSQFVLSSNWWIYLGGAIGVATVFLSNVVVVKIPALYITLLMFVGQVFTGVLLDALLDGAFSLQNLIGGVFVAFGLTLNLLFERRDSRKAAALYREQND